MENLYIVNYCHNDCLPLKSITQLSKEEAFLMAKELSKKDKCRALNRFGDDFPGYYQHRIRTEQWLYEHFIAIGGKPQTRHLFYFALHQSEDLNKNFNYGKIIKVPLDDIDSDDISFTFGDSVAKFDVPERRNPFLKGKLYEYVNSYNNDVEKFLVSIKEQYIIIEAQLWTDKYFINLT